MTEIDIDIVESTGDQTESNIDELEKVNKNILTDGLFPENEESKLKISYLIYYQALKSGRDNDNKKKGKLYPLWGGQHLLFTKFIAARSQEIQLNHVLCNDISPEQADLVCILIPQKLLAITDLKIQIKDNKVIKTNHLEDKEKITFNRPLLIIGANEDNKEDLGGKISFFNSSIMMRAVEYKKDDEINPEIKDYIDWLKQDISSSFPLTKSQIANESLEYAFRAYSNSYLFGGHKNVSPFSFHSELDFKEKFKKEKKDLSDLITAIEPNESLELNLLLVDDQSETGLKKWQDGVYKVVEKDKKGKKDILTALLEKKINGSEEDWQNIKFKIECISSADFDNINTKITPPDIILLDYSFGENKTKGSEFFATLMGNEQGQEKISKGPFGQYWIMPITAFGNSFIDDLRSKGFGFVSNDYNLSRGADFITTPYLFLYYFTKMINQILLDLRETIENIQCLEKKVQACENWEDLNDLQKLAAKSFSEHIEKKAKLNDYLKAEYGILASVRKNKAEEKVHKFQKELNFYEQLLYNLAYRNYEGNEEIIIFHDLLKNQ